MRQHVVKASVIALTALLNGCCTTSHRLARISQPATGEHASLSQIVMIITNALRALDVSRKTEELSGRGTTVFMVRNGTRSASVGVDHESLTIYVSWRASESHDFPRQLETAISKEFSDRIHGQLRFEDAPCDVMGP